MKADYFLKGIELVPEYLLGIVIIYLAIILFINIVGLKSFSKMSSYDFAHTIAIGSLIASAVSTGTPSIFVAVILIGALFFIKFAISYIQKRSSTFENLVNNSPIFLMRNGLILEENLKKSRVTKSELMGKLREANVFQFSNVKAVVLETTGDISVLHTSDDQEIQVEIIEGVEGN